MPLSKKILFLLCFFSATSSWLVAFPGFEEADLEEESKILASDLLDGLTTSTPTTEPVPAASSVHPTQTSSSSSMMNSISTTAPGVGTQKTEVDPRVKTAVTSNSTTPFDVPVEQVKVSEEREPLSPHDFQNLTFGNTKCSAPGVIDMCIKDPQIKIEEYKALQKNLEESATTGGISNQSNRSLEGITDALKIMEAANAYRLNWILQRNQNEENSANTKQPIVSFATALHLQQEMLHKNIDKIMDIAKRVEELHELKKKWSIACNELQETGQAQSDRGVLLNVQINKAQEAINQYLQFAETIRDKTIIEKDSPQKPSLMAAAKEAKKSGHANYSSVLKFEANEQSTDYWRQAWEARNQGNEAEPERYRNAVLAAEKAAMEFQRANKAGISEDAQNMYILSGRYKLKQAEAIIQRNVIQAQRYDEAASAFSGASNTFGHANTAGISEDEKNARNLSARYCLQQAEAIIQGNVIQAQRYKDADLVASSAASQFKEVSNTGILEDEKNARNLSARYCLQQAEAIIQGNMIQAQRYDEAASAMNRAACQFKDANQERISEDEKNARNLFARYYLQQAEAIIQGKKMEVKQYGEAASAMNTAADQFKDANQERISEDEKNARNLSSRYRFKQVEAIMQGDMIQAQRYDEAAFAMHRAAYLFQDVNKAELSENQRFFLIQKGKDLLAKYESDFAAYELKQKQKKAEEQTKERYKEYHQKYNSRSSFKRGL